ncbi:MAG TPA: sulfotransferase [Vitreimonas sp.]|uniref:tetratricopeptide repeat-containing sulfotransferase family protein n=1 Tax=Vitreimonas sp. TaxID=3069702 RepID=UPI002D39393F|nr:sulfotransferase [Vitreimonas sp.]HYD88767.1 sulfotransferase [Vitreimonas sp.]
MPNENELTQIVQRFGAMRALAGRAKAENPNDPRALFGAGVAYRLLGDYAAAAEAFARVSVLQPNNAPVLFELGLAQEYSGKFEAAIKAYERALGAAPDYFKAREALVRLQKQTPERNSIALMEAQFAGPDEDGWRTAHLGHALAKTYEDFGDVEKSFAWLKRGKAKRKALSPYDAAKEEALARAAIDAGPPATAGFDSNEPIFVSGLPRSGTTLVDRILSSHPDVISIGEIGNFALLNKKLSDSPTRPTLDADTLARANAVDYARLGKLYIDSTRPLSGATPRFVDKAPSNYLLAGAIVRALPNARVIAVRRHPLDSVVSNYKQLFPLDDRFYDYVYDIEFAAHKFVQFDRVLRHWQATLPADRFMPLQYEDLIAGQEEMTRRVVAFCGLDWNDRCLAFHRNAAGVGTPSAAQVRVPLYNTAIGRWKRYGALLDPAKRVFERAGVEI